MILFLKLIWCIYTAFILALWFNVLSMYIIMLVTTDSWVWKDLLCVNKIIDWLTDLIEVNDALQTHVQFSWHPISW